MIKLINLYGFVYAHGTAIYRDRNLTDFYCYDPWHEHRKSKVVEYNGFKFYLNIIKPKKDDKTGSN